MINAAPDGVLFETLLLGRPPIRLAISATYERASGETSMTESARALSSVYRGLDFGKTRDVGVEALASESWNSGLAALSKGRWSVVANGAGGATLTSISRH